MIAERQILAQTPSYSRAALEQRILSRVQQFTVPVHPRIKPPDPEERAAHDLLIDAFRFVLEEHTARSLGYTNAVTEYDSLPTPTLAYPVLPTDSQIQVFAAQTTAAWEDALDHARSEKVAKNRPET